jgi:hypothetical protein
MILEITTYTLHSPTPTTPPTPPTPSKPTTPTTPPPSQSLPLFLYGSPGSFQLPGGLHFALLPGYARISPELSLYRSPAQSAYIKPTPSSRSFVLGYLAYGIDPEDLEAVRLAYQVGMRRRVYNPSAL